MNRTPKYITPGLSPILKKYRTAEGYANVVDIKNNIRIESDTEQLKRILSIDPILKTTILKSILSNKNVCIHPYDLGFIYSREYEIDSILDVNMIQDLNEAYLTHDYTDWYDKYYEVLSSGKFNDNGFFNQILPEINNVQRTTFIDCDKRYIIYPIVSYGFGLDEKFIFGAHACFCIYDNNTRKGYYFDPMQFELEKYEEGLPKIDEINRRKIASYKVLNVIRASNPFLPIRDVEIVDITTPQQIADDYNCLFWSLLLCDIICRNLKEDEPFRPKLMIQSLLKKYNTKEKLLKVIGRYIGYVYEQAKAEVNKKTKFKFRNTPQPNDIPKSFYRNILKNTYVRKTQS